MDLLHTSKISTDPQSIYTDQDQLDQDYLAKIFDTDKAVTGLRLYNRGIKQNILIPLPDAHEYVIRLERRDKPKVIEIPKGARLRFAKLLVEAANNQSMKVRVDIDIYRQETDDKSEKESTVRFLIDQGVILHESNRYMEAIEFFDKALKNNPKSVLAHYEKALTLASLGKIKESMDSYNSALAIDPKFEQAWINKAALLSNELGRYEEALICYNIALELDPEDTKAILNKAIVLSYLRKDNEALNFLEKKIEVDPNNAKFWIQKARLLKQLGRKEEAIAAIEIFRNIANWKNEDAEYIFNQLSTI